MSRAVAVGLTLCFAPACYSRANFSYAANPDLAPVRMSAGAVRQRIDHLGLVQTSVTGREPCEEIVVQAMRDLLAEAKVLGGSGVEEVQFRGRWSWLGQPVCRGLVWKTAYVRGFAVK